MTGFNNGTVYGSNVDFSGASAPSPQMISNGQLLIGSSVAPNIRVGQLTSSDSSVTINVGNGTIDLRASGGGQAIVYTAINNASSPYTVLSTDYYISVDASGGTVTITLPSSTTANRLFIIKDRLGNAGTNNITIQSSGGTTVDGQSTLLIANNFGAVQLLFHGTNYEVY